MTERDSNSERPDSELTLPEYMKRLSERSNRTITELERDIVNNYVEPSERWYAVYEELKEKGFDPYDPTLYEEFNNPLDRRFYNDALQRIDHQKNKLPAIEAENRRITEINRRNDRGLVRRISDYIKEKRNS